MGRRDLLVAAVAGALSIGTFVAVPSAGDDATSSADPGSAGWWVVLALLLLDALLLLGVRRRPVPVLLATAAASVGAAAAGAGDATSVAFVAVVVATFLTASATPLRRRWPAIVGAAALVAVASGIGAHTAGDALGVVVAGSLVQATGTLGLTVLVAVVVSTRREAAQARTAQLEAVAREQDALVQAAIARERTAMARELHDIAAHHLSGIAVMTAAIGTQIDTDPAAAKAAVLQVRQQSTSVLRDLRSLVGLLRDTPDGSGDDPRPETIAGIAGLVADAAGTGRDVGLVVLSERPVVGDGVGPLAQLAAYRAVQEALSNAARHAPGAACEVTVDDRADDAVVVTVRNGRPPAVAPSGPADATGRTGGGYGLVGMRERAELTGSTLEVGPTDDGGWRVAVRLPREEA